MLKAAKTHRVSFAAVKLSADLKERMPAWFHLGALPRTYHATRDRCIAEIHHVQSIRDLMTMVKRVSRGNAPHKNRRNCACTACRSDCMQGCINPNACCKAANGILANLKPKYDVREQPEGDGLTLTNRRLAVNERGRANMKHGVTLFLIRQSQQRVCWPTASGFS
jgi:hypothetical protein